MSNAPSSNPGNSESERRKLPNQGPAYSWMFNTDLSWDEIQADLKADDGSASSPARKHDLEAVERELKAREEASRAAGHIEEADHFAKELERLRALVKEQTKKIL